MRKSRSTNFQSKKSKEDSDPQLAPGLLINANDLEYCIESPIGNGAFGSVYKARLKSQNRDVALKIYNIDSSNSRSSDRLLSNVVRELTSLDHPNIIKCFGMCLDKRAIVLQLAEKQITLDSQPVKVNSLRQLINVLGEEEVFPDWVALDAMYQIALGLEYLHTRQVYHGDLKSANVLVSEGTNKESQFLFLLADFGQPQSAITSLQVGSTVGHQKNGTVSHEAPEVFTTGKKSGSQSDMYSFALVVHELLVPKHKYPWEAVFAGSRPATINALIVQAVIRGERPPVPNFEDIAFCGALEIMKECWVQNADERPTAKQVQDKLLTLQGEIDEAEDVSKSTQKSDSKQQQTPKATFLAGAKQSPLKRACQQKNSNKAKRVLDFPSQKESYQTGNDHQTGDSTGIQFNNGSSNIDNRTSINPQPAQGGNEMLMDGNGFGGGRTLSEDDASNEAVDYSVDHPVASTPNCSGRAARKLNFDVSLVESLNDMDDGSPPISASADNNAVDELNDSFQLQTSRSSPSAADKTVLEMAWLGFVNNRREDKIKELKEFQLEALHSLGAKKDTFLIQPTGSGKSLCFFIPTMTLQGTDSYVILLGPTVALCECHLQTATDMQISAIFLNGSSKKKDYDFAFGSTNTNRPNLIIMQPEVLFGTSTTAGVLNNIDSGRLALLVLEEAHLVRDWNSFRPSFNELSQLKDLFRLCPILAMTATITPAVLEEIAASFLRQPNIIRSSVNRPNVSISFTDYSLTQSEDKENKWSDTANQVYKLVGNETTIVYLNYSADCVDFYKCLKKLEVQAEVFTGQQTVDEKRAIFSRFKNRDEDRDKELDIHILVATKAFGVGVDVPHVRNVVHIGFPSNMSDLIQAWGRAGRDGKDAHAFLFFNEYNDLKSLSYFTKNMTATEKMARYQHFSDVFEFYSSVFIGTCLRQCIRRYFGDQELIEASNGDCCEGCKIKRTLQFAENRKIHGVAQTLSFFEDSRLMKVYEKQLVSWWRADEGIDGNWMSAYFNDQDKKNHSTYGIQQEKSKEETKVFFKGLLRQMLALGYVRIQFQPLPQSDIMTKVWFLSDSGRKLGKASDEELAECLPQLPDPVQVVKFLSRSRDSDSTKEKSTEKPKRASRGKDMVSRTISMLKKGENSWIPIKMKKQFQFLGFFHDTDRLLFTPDYTTLKSNPTSASKPDFLRDDLNLSKSSGFPPKTISVDSVDYNLYRHQCNGVKACTGRDCDFAVANKMRENTCLRHPDATLKWTGQCDVYFVYLKPVEESDNRRWLGVMSKIPGKEPLCHSHPLPVESKLPQLLKADMQKSLSEDPTHTANDLSKGIGLPYNPVAVSLAAANTVTFSNAVNKLKKQCGKAGQNLIMKFQELVQRNIDQRDAQQMEDQELIDEVAKLTSPYLRFHPYPEMKDDFEMVVFATPQMLATLAHATFLQVDVTFPETPDYKYEMNFVAFNHETLRYQAVSRVLMNNLSSHAYAFAFSKVFGIATNIHPQYANGQNLEAILMDFSTAQAEGLSKVIGEKEAAEVIRGCEVHYQRNVKKICDKTCSDEKTKMLFKAVAYKIPYLETKEYVQLAFDTLTGDVSLEDDSAKQLFQHLRISEDQVSDVDTKNWSKSKPWAKFWRRAKTCTMYTVAYTLMSHAQWEACATTTNAVEAINKQSKLKTTMLLPVVQNLYQTDRKHAWLEVAAKHGISTGVNEKKRKLMNDQKRKTRAKRQKILIEEEEAASSTVTKSKSCAVTGGEKTRKVNPAKSGGKCNQVGRPTKSASSGKLTRHENTAEMDNDDEPCLRNDPNDETEPPAPARKRGRPRKNQPAISTVPPSCSTVVPDEVSADVSNSDDEDERSFIGITVYIDTVGRTKKYGFLPAVVEKKNDEGKYVARYTAGRRHYVVIDDIKDEKVVRFFPVPATEA